MPAAGLLALAYAAFVSLGLPDGVLGVAWPSLRSAFELPQSALGLLSVGLGSGYVLSSFFAGRLVGRFGVGPVLWASSALAAAGLALHGAAPAWLLFTAGAPLVGLGSGAVDAALNLHVARAFRPRHVNWLHACYSLGAMLGPLGMSLAIHRADSWRAGYAGLSCLLLALAVLFAATSGRWGRAASTSPAAPTAGLLRHPLALLQTAVFLVYTGLEATLGAWAYTVMAERRAIPGPRAAAWVAAYFGGIALGRVLFGFGVERWGADRLVRAGAWAAAGAAALFAFAPSEGLQAAGLAAAGLALAPVFPCLMSRTPARLGDGLAAHAVGVQVAAATVGAALGPALGGLLAARLGLEAAALEAAALAVLLALLHERLLRASTSAA